MGLAEQLSFEAKTNCFFGLFSLDNIFSQNGVKVKATPK